MDAHPLRLSPALLTAALPCFFYLPCLEFTFSDKSMGTFTFRDFLRGFTAPPPYDYFPSLSVAPNASATVLLVCLIAGSVLSLFPGRRNQAACSVLAVIAGISIWQIQADVADALYIHHLQQAQAVYQPAFYILFALLVPVALLGVPYAAFARTFNSLRLYSRRRKLRLENAAPIV